MKRTSRTQTQRQPNNDKLRSIPSADLARVTGGLGLDPKIDKIEHKLGSDDQN